MATARAFRSICAVTFALGWGQIAIAKEYVGAERCGACHQVEYKQWKQSGHARALSRLTEVQRRDAGCRSCHTLEPSSTEVALEGVQCESCHGAGELYEPSYVMRDKVLAKLLGLKPVSKNTCMGCHSIDAPSVKPFDFEEKVKLVQHRSKTKEQSRATVHQKDALAVQETKR